jgi:aerobic carbon-monoxide dehydrogenase large subunit
MTAGHPLIGQDIRRVEDERFLRGAGRFVDDVHCPGALHAVFVRSTYAHARIVTVALEEARARPGVVMVATAGDVQQAKPIPVRATVEGALALSAPLLASDRVRYLGEPIAVVLAEDRGLAEDAARALEIDYDPLPVAASAQAALALDAPRLHDELTNNICYDMQLSSGDVEAAFREAATIVCVTARHQRLAPTALEPRCVLAEPDGQGGLTLWLSSQAPFRARDTLVHTLGLPKDRVRVLVPDVGGGFGAKATVYREDVSFCARLRSDWADRSNGWRRAWKTSPTRIMRGIMRTTPKPPSPPTGGCWRSAPGLYRGSALTFTGTG